jgi:hypothetical protein
MCEEYRNLLGTGVPDCTLGARPALDVSVLLATLRLNVHPAASLTGAAAAFLLPFGNGFRRHRAGADRHIA